MIYSLTYKMQTGEGCRYSPTAGEAVRDYALLRLAGGSGIVIRDDGCLIVSLAAVTALGKLEPLAIAGALDT